MPILMPFLSKFTSSFIWESGDIYSPLSRSNTARGSSTGLVTVRPTKPSKSLLFTNESSVDFAKGGGDGC